MRTIKGVLFEPVGCLAEFPPEPFLEIAARLSGHKKQTSKSGSRAYWHLLNLMDARREEGDEALEIESVERACLYEDVIPALAELQAMDIRLMVASSLSHGAATHFLARCPHTFEAVWTRDNSKGIKAVPLESALAAAALPAANTMFLTDTAEGLKVAKSVGVNPILMMNDPDESRRLAMHHPAGGIVSLHELPDFIRLLRAQQ
jgi:phosphoglycolate phosphatase-like HAD superfamily hydrolase